MRAAAPLLAVAALAAVPAAANAALQTEVALDKAITGTANFDPQAGPGRDTSADNDVVRVNDTVTYRWSVNVNETTGQQGTFDRVSFKQTLAEGLSWKSGDVPAYCKGPGWSISGRTLTCVFVPAGGTGMTGTTMSFSLTATADAAKDGTVATAPADAVSVVAIDGTDESAAATATVAPVTLRAAPFLDFEKLAPSVSRANNSPTSDYVLSYPINVVVPQSRRSTFGLRGFDLPDVPITFTDDLTAISPNVEYLGCDPQNGTAVDCALDGKSVAITVSKLRNDAASTNQNVASLRLRVRVPFSDVADSPQQKLTTLNEIKGFNASSQAADGSRIAFEGEDPDNNRRSYNLTGDTGVDVGTFGYGKRFRTATGGRLPTQTSDDDGNGQVLAGQVITSRLQISGRRQTGAICDVWDHQHLQLTSEGLAAGQAPVRLSGGLPSGWDGDDYVIEYGTRPVSSATDDETRWTAERAASACTDESDDWTATPPADLSTVTKVRVRLAGNLPDTNATLTFLANLKVARDTPDDTILANFLGTKTQTGTWTASNYRPATHDGRDRGDRVRVNGITVSIEKVAIVDDAPVPNGTPVSIVSGNGVQFGLNPKVTTEEGDVATPTATNVVVRDRLPAGMRYDETKPTGPDGLKPTVSTDADGRQILTWRIPSMTRGQEPKITFWVTTASTRIGDLVNEAIVDSTEDVQGLEAFPTGTTPTGDRHFSRQTVRLDSAGAVQISKDTDQLFVEPGDALRYTVTYANLSPDPVENAEIIDVLPFVGDDANQDGVVGRNPATALNGTVPLAGVEPGDGETVTYTDAAPIDVFKATSHRSTDGYGPLPAGHAWCTEAQFGTADCPDAMTDVTAFRLQRTGSLASGANVTATVRLQPDGNRSGDIYSNTAAIRWTGGSLGALSNVATIRVVASSIGDFVWEDANENGRQDADEKPLANVRVTLSGTDKHGREINLETRTDENGRYLFTSSTQAGQDAGVLDLVSGRYVVTFHRDGLPTGTRFTTTRGDGVDPAEDSDADGTTGRSQEFVLPDPSPTGQDGQDLTLDAGVILGAGDPPAEQPPTTEEQPPPPPPTVTTPPAPPIPPRVEA
ncbi:SdrD B-like domain-containing protein, partial [Patulibacter sp. S7RM1-6]